MTRHLLQVDLSNQVYRAAAVHSMLRDDGGRFIGGLYGFIVSLCKAIEVTEATDVIVCRDVKPYLRSRDYPEYKLLRRADQDPDLRRDYLESEPYVMDFLAAMRIPTWGVSGFECDDLIAFTVQRMWHRFDTVTAMSNDSDLWQLFDRSGFRIYKDAKHVLTRENTLDAMGITADQYVRLLALTGTHNEIGGVEGVAEKTALKILGDPAKLRQYLDRHADLIARNEALIRLPHPELGWPPIPRLDPKPGFTAADLYKFCGPFDIEAKPWWISSLRQVLT